MITLRVRKKVAAHGTGLSAPRHHNVAKMVTPLGPDLLASTTNAVRQQGHSVTLAEVDRSFGAVTASHAMAAHVNECSPRAPI